MQELIQTFLIAVLLQSHITFAVHSNLFYGRSSVAYPGLHSACGGVLQNAYATDRVMTRFLVDFCDQPKYMFVTAFSLDCSLTIFLPEGTVIRSVLLSQWDQRVFNGGIGMIVSVGESLATSKRCYFTNYGQTRTSAPTGRSAWLTCDNLVGSKFFVTNPTVQRVQLYEVMAFSQYNLIPMASIYPLYSTAAMSGSLQNNLLKTEMFIQTGTTSTCYTSVSDTQPSIAIKFDAAIDIQTFLAIPQIPQGYVVDYSTLYSSNLVIEVYKLATLTDTPEQLMQLVGACDPIADPLLDAESDCQSYVGNMIKITRSCPTTPCHLGLCGVGVLSNCDCSKSQIGADYFNNTIAQWQSAYSNKVSLLSDTQIKIKFQREGTIVKLNMQKINILPDSVSTVCGDILDGIKFCGLSRKFVILDSQGIELDLQTSDLFRLDTLTGVLNVKTQNEFYIGVNQFTLTARLSDYPDKGFFPVYTKFQVEVTIDETVILTPQLPTSYTYTIGSKMEPLTFKVNFLIQNFSLVVNDQRVDNSFETYGLVLSYMSLGSDTVIFLSSSYEKNDLAGYVLNLMLTFTLANQTFFFQPITVAYISSLQSQPIPCLTSLDAVKWEYNLPKEIYSKLNNVKVTFECIELQNILIFNQQRMSLYLNTIISIKQPVSRSYKATFTIQDSYQGKKSYELLLNVNCSSSKFEFNNSQQQQNNKTFKPKTPIPIIIEITSFGEITIKWNQNMTNQFDQLIVLQASRVNFRFPPSPYLNSLIDVKVMQQSDPEIVPPSLLNFTFAFQQFNSTISKIYVRFENPLYISYGTKKDKIKINFNFLNVSTQSDLPRQQSVESFQINTNAVQKISSSILWSAPIVQIFLGGAMSGVLKFISVQVLIRHMFSPSLIIPVNLQKILLGLLPLLTLDMIPTDQIYERIFAFSELTDEPLTQQFDGIGYSQTLSVKNMGFLFVILILTPIQTTLLYILSKFLHLFRLKTRFLRKIKNIVDSQLESMIWNGYIQFFQQQCLVFCVISFIQISDLRLSPDFTATEQFCSALAILILLSYLVFPIILLILYIVRFRSSKPLPDLDDRMSVENIKYVYGTIRIEKIQDSVYFQSNHHLFMKKFGILIKGIQISRLGKAWSISIGFLQIARQIILSIGVIYFREQPVLLIFLFNTTSLFFALIKIHLKPYEERQKQWVQVFQEIAILLISYSLICFTGYVEPEDAVVVGDWTSVIIIAQMFVFFGLGIQHVFHKIRLLYGRYRFRKQQKLKKKVPFSEVLKRLAALHTPKYVWQSKQDKQVKSTQLQVVAEELNNREESQSIKSQRNTQSEVRYEESKSEIYNAISQFSTNNQKINALVLENYSLQNEIQNIQAIAEQKKGVSNDQLSLDIYYVKKRKTLQQNQQSGRNPSSVVVSDVPSVKSVNESISTIKLSESGNNCYNIVENDLSKQNPQRLYKNRNKSIFVSDDQSFKMKPKKMPRRRNPSSIVSKDSKIYSEKLSSVNLNKSL